MAIFAQLQENSKEWALGVLLPRLTGLFRTGGGVVKALTTHFEGFFNEDAFFQCATEPRYYCNKEYNIYMYHDFDAYTPLHRQMKSFRDKYTRRIERLYNNMLEPTLFIRYISDEDVDSTGKSIELKKIEKDYEHLIWFIKQFNEQNDIMWIANEGVQSKKIKIYHVQKDDGDSVARVFLEKNAELKKLFLSADFPLRKVNLEYNHRGVSKMPLALRIRMRLSKPYKHIRQY